MPAETYAVFFLVSANTLLECRTSAAGEFHGCAAIDGSIDRSVGRWVGRLCKFRCGDALSINI